MTQWQIFIDCVKLLHQSELPLWVRIVFYPAWLIISWGMAEGAKQILDAITMRELKGSDDAKQV